MRVRGVEWKFNGSPIPTPRSWSVKDICQVKKVILCIWREPHLLTVSFPTPLCSERRYKFIFGRKLSRLWCELQKGMLVSKPGKINKRRFDLSVKDVVLLKEAAQTFHSSRDPLGPVFPPWGALSSALDSVCPARPHPHFLTQPYFLLPSWLWFLLPATSPEPPLLGWPTWDHCSHNDLTLIHDS